MEWPEGRWSVIEMRSSVGRHSRGDCGRGLAGVCCCGGRSDGPTVGMLYVS